MDMTVNTQKPVDTQTILGAAGTTGGTAVQGTEETGAVSGENLIVEETEEKTAAGRTETANEIDAPTGTTDSGVIDEVYALLQESNLKDHKALNQTLAGLLTDEKVVTALTTASTSSTQSAMFCLYRILALLLEVGEEEREAARNMRQAETENLISQMEDQRQALLDTAVASLVSTVVINTVMSAQVGYSMMQISNAATLENDSVRMSGRATFAKISEMAANPTDEKIATVKADAAKTLPQSTIDQMNGENKTYAEYKSEWKAEVKEFRVKAETGTVTDADRTKMNTANAKLQYAAALEAEKNNTLPTNTSAKIEATNAFKSQNTEENLPTLTRNVAANPTTENIKAAENDAKVAEEGVNPMLSAEECSQIEKDISSGTKTFADYKKEWQAAQADFQQKMNGNQAVDLDAMDKPNAKLNYAAAQEAKRINGLSTETPQDQAKVKFKHTAETDYTKSTAYDKNSSLTTKAQNLETRTRVKAQLFETVGRIAQAGIDYGKELMNSQQKAYDQTIELAKFNRDTSTDLVQTAMDLFKGILNVLKSVIDAEDRNVQEIMG